MPDSNLADGEVLTSTFFNTYIREQVVVTCTSGTRPSAVEGRCIYETDTDQLLVYDGSAWVVFGGTGWTSFTPSWTNVTVGNGTQAGRYRYIGSVMELWVTLTFGSTSSITGTPTLTLPNSEVSSSTIGSANLPVGQVLFGDTGTATFFGYTSIDGTSSTLRMFVPNVGGTYPSAANVSSTVPFTWTTTDTLRLTATIPLD